MAIKKLNLDELANAVYNLSDDKTIIFALIYYGSESKIEIDEEKCFDWYYIQRRSNKFFNSDYWVIDRCGGSYAGAYPLDKDVNEYDVSVCISEYFNDWGIDIDTERFYVEMED